MHRLWVFLGVAVIAALAASCSSKPQTAGIPYWDHDRDARPVGSVLLGPIAGLIGGTYDKRVVNAVGAAAGHLLSINQERIRLSPTQLRGIIVDALKTGYKKPESPNSLPQARPSASISSQSPRPISISWQVDEINEGVITTNWRPISGKIAGILWWTREYETQVRHIITISRSLDSPQFANFSIATEVRERPNSNYPWQAGDPELGRESFQQLRETLVDSIHQLMKETSAARVYK